MNVGKFCPLPLCNLIGNVRIYIYIYILFLLSLSCRTGSATTGSTGSQFMYIHGTFPLLALAVNSLVCALSSSVSSDTACAGCKNGA